MRRYLLVRIKKQVKKQGFRSHIEVNRQDRFVILIQPCIDCPSRSGEPPKERKAEGPQNHRDGPQKTMALAIETASL